MYLTTKIFITSQVPGLHYWPQAQEKSKNHKYLSSPHRHLFHIKVTKYVYHNNRDIEFLDLKDQLANVLTQVWPCAINTYTHDFGAMSCEMIADRLLYMLNADEVEVSEDGENGAVVTKEFD